MTATLCPTTAASTEGTDDTLARIGAATLSVISLMDAMGHDTIAGHLHYQTTRRGTDADLVLDLLAVAANSRTRGDPDVLLRGLKDYTRAIGWGSGMAEATAAAIPRHQEEA